MIDDELLQRYLDGELNQDQAAEVERLLRQDPTLRRRVAELRAVEHAYRALRDTAIPSQRRELLLDQIRRAPQTAHYDLVQRTDLEALAEVYDPNTPIISLYLDLRPEQHGPPQARFKSLLRQAEQRIRAERRAAEYYDQWTEESAYLSEWFDQRALEGRGLAVLSSQALGLWRAYRLPVPVRDRIEVGDRPYLRPLMTLLDEFERYLVVLIDAGSVRLIESYLGTVEEVGLLPGYVPPATGHFVEKTGRRHDAYLHLHAKQAAEYTERFWNEQNYNWLVIGGTEEALGALRDQLPNALRQRLAGELRLSPQAPLEQVRDQVLAIEHEHEQRTEAQRVEALLNAAHTTGAGVLGLEATLRAVAEQRVRLLIVEEDYTPEGKECPQCGWLTTNDAERCPLCDSPLDPQPDVIASALARVLTYKGEIEVLRSPQSRQALTQYGRIGALLRY